MPTISALEAFEKDLNSKSVVAFRVAAKSCNQALHDQASEDSAVNEYCVVQ